MKLEILCVTTLKIIKKKGQNEHKKRAPSDKVRSLITQIL